MCGGRNGGGEAHPGDLDPVQRGPDRVQRGPHIEKGELSVLVHVTAIVVVNHIAHLTTTTVDHPVVTVEWELVAGRRNGLEVPSSLDGIYRRDCKE